MTTVSQRFNKPDWILLAAFAVSAFALPSLPANAQSRSTGSQSVGREGAARAAWQPVRDASERDEKTRPEKAKIQLVEHQMSLGQPTNRVHARTAVHQRNRQPTPARPAAASVISHPVVHDGIPIDGQIQYDSVHEGDVIYEGGPVYENGPVYEDGGFYEDGPIYGGGGNSNGGCDGIGCSSGACCNGDPMCGEYRDCDSLRPCLTLCWPQDGWASAEYLMWWQDGMALPPLASTGRLSGRTPLANGSVLFGGNDVLDDQLNGYRFDFGFWLDRCHTWGVGGGFFGLDRENVGFSAGAGTDPLVRPIITVLDDNDPLSVDDLTEGVALVNNPSRGHTGNLDISVDSRLSGWDTYVRHFTKADSGCTCLGACHCPQRWCSRSEHRIGFRQVQLDEGIAISSNVLIPDVPLSFGLNESFRTWNQFNGVDVGWLHSRSIGYWNFDLGLRLAAGSTRQRVRIHGSTLINGTQPAVQGGLLALNSNIGDYQRDEFTVLPELNAKMGYQLTDQLRLTFGYTGLYWSNVVRPGDQIDRIIEQAQIPNAISSAPTPNGVFPRFSFNQTDYWAQGINFGLDYRW